MVKKLKKIVDECEVCDEQTKFKYVGTMGVPWRVKDIYRCKQCGYLKEYRGENEHK